MTFASHLSSYPMWKTMVVLQSLQYPHLLTHIKQQAKHSAPWLQRKLSRMSATCKSTGESWSWRLLAPCVDLDCTISQYSATTNSQTDNEQCAIIIENLDYSMHNFWWLLPLSNTHTHTHPFNGPFSGTTRVSRYQKGKTNLDFTEARDSEWQWHQLGHMQVSTSLQTDNHASTPPLSFFTGRMPFLLPNQQRQSTEGTSQRDANYI